MQQRRHRRLYVDDGEGVGDGHDARGNGDHETGHPHHGDDAGAAGVTRVININDDTKGQSFEPNNTSVFVGSIVRFTNLDSRSHTIEGRRKEFVSPPIAPGASWDYKPNVVGQIELVDQERPYAIGYLNVVGRS